MRRSWLVWFAAAGVVWACNNPTGAGGGCASTHAVTIRAGNNLQFSPQTITISRGQTVCWENTGDSTHTITPDSVATTDSAWAAYPEQPLLPGLPVLIQAFGATGNYYYHCFYHGAKMSGMYGIIQVR